MGRAFEYRRASKEARWDKMSKLFPKLAKAITMAAKEGGADLESNTKLRTAINNAKAENMPKDNIDKAIKRATSKDLSAFSEVHYEGKGPHGVLLWVECATDNNTRTFSHIRLLFNKNNGELMSTGSFNFMFNRKAVIEFNQEAEHDMESIELELIDVGLEELEIEGDKVKVLGDFASFNTLSKAIEEMGIKMTKAGLEYIPTQPVELSEEQLEEVEVLIDKLEDDEDVQKVFTNIA